MTKLPGYLQDKGTKLKEHADYSESAILALHQFQPKYTVDQWRTEVAVGMEDEGLSFKEAVYSALVENFEDQEPEQPYHEYVYEQTP